MGSAKVRKLNACKHPLYSIMTEIWIWAASAKVICIFRDEKTTKRNRLSYTFMYVYMFVYVSTFLSKLLMVYLE